MNLQEITDTAIAPAMCLLPPAMDTIQARVMLLAIGLQESRFEYRRQLGNGPARGFWQFELGTAASKGGVWGVFLHPASGNLLRTIAKQRGLQLPAPTSIYRAIEHDDVLAAVTARLLLWTDSQPLPSLGDVNGAWELYAKRCWRPGKPHRETWDGFYTQALDFVKKAAA